MLLGFAIDKSGLAGKFLRLTGISLLCAAFPGNVARSLVSSSMMNSSKLVIINFNKASI